MCNFLFIQGREGKKGHTQRTLPGIDQACFHIAEMLRTAMTWAVGMRPEEE